jgi:hypothetical protein
MIREGNMKSLKLILLMHALGVPLMGDNCDDREVKEEQKEEQKKTEKELNCAALTNKSDCNKTANRCRWVVFWLLNSPQKCREGRATGCPLFISDTALTESEQIICEAAGCTTIGVSESLSKTGKFYISCTPKGLDFKARCPTEYSWWASKENCESIGCEYVPEVVTTEESCVDNS